MFFYELNKWFWTLPSWLHLITFTILVGLYAHLFFGFLMIKHRLKPHVVRFFWIRTTTILVYLFLKADDDQLGMFDLFLPIYLIGYIDGLIIINGLGFYRCPNMRSAIRRIFSFRTHKRR